MRQLEHMAASQQVVDADYFEASIGQGAVLSPTSGLMQLTLASAGSTTVADYQVTQAQGCYFMRYA